MADDGPILFVTGKLAEAALRRVLQQIATKTSLKYEVQVMPITVAALLTTPWVAKRLTIPPGMQRVILPGLCAGDLAAVQAVSPVPVVLGPTDLRDLPEYFGQKSGPPADYGQHDIEGRDSRYCHALPKQRGRGHRLGV
jgi:hypothetical protein